MCHQKCFFGGGLGKKEGGKADLVRGFQLWTWLLRSINCRIAASLRRRLKAVEKPPLVQEEAVGWAGSGRG